MYASQVQDLLLGKDLHVYLHHFCHVFCRFWRPVCWLFHGERFPDAVSNLQLSLQPK